MKIISDFLEIIKENLNDIINDKKLIFFSTIWLLFIFGLAFYIYKSYIRPKLSEHKLNKEFINKENNSEDIRIMYFYTEWCPYCKKAKPEWSKFQTYINNITRNLDYNIYLTTINCDEQKDLADKYNIEGYPTVKLIYKSDVYDFDAKITKNNLIEFLESIK
tara:strand:- start:10296 stop:10781 length:486 start_codon:yes stop_codon:yes gene_type:complete